MENKPIEELRTLAKDIHRGAVFTDRHILGDQPEMVGMVFMVLALMKSEQIKALAADPPEMIYEYLEKAGPRGVNGLPCFFSMQMINKHDFDLVFKMIDALKEAETHALEGIENEAN